MGDKATAPASKGWVKAYNKLLKFQGDELLEDRAEDFHALLRTGTAGGKIAAKKSLEEFGATDGTGKLWLRDMDTLYEKTYRYDSFEPAGGWQNFDGIFPNRPQGWYCSFDYFNNKYIATDRLYLPLQTSGPAYRFEFRTEVIKNNLRAV